MRRQFFLLFCSIVVILAVLMAIETVAVFLGAWVVERNWEKQIFEEFISELEGFIDYLNDDEAGTVNDNADVISMMFKSTSERISGCLLRDERGKFVLSFGSTPMGVLVPTPRKKIDTELLLITEGAEDYFGVTFQDQVLYLERQVKSPAYMLSIFTEPSTGKPERIVLDELGKGAETLVFLPEMVKNQDIAGTVVISLDGEIKGYIDILVYRVNAYRPTAFLFRQLCISLFCFAFPVSLVVAVIMAFAVSRSSVRKIAGIQKALEAIARGDYSIKVPPQGIEEFNGIADSVNQLSSDLDRHQRARKEWIRNISHDLNTPVASLSLLVSGVQDGVFPVNEDLMDQFKAEVDTLSSRISSVNYYSQLLFPETKACREELSMLDVLDEVLMATKLSLLVPETDAVVYADRKMLIRALTEVIKNANDYGDKTETPALAASHGKDNLIIEVRNKGSLPKPLPQFFEPWARGDASRSSGGSGLGFPIVAQIMELHRGKVTVFEDDDHVVVRLLFPFKAAAKA